MGERVRDSRDAALPGEDAMNANMEIQLKRRALAACVAAICAVAAPVVSATVPAPVAAVATAPSAPTTTIVVTNCEDSGAGSLRDAVNNAVSGDIIDLTQLACSTITLTSGTIATSDNDLTLIGPGTSALQIIGVASNNESVIYHTGYGTLNISGMMISGGNKYLTGGSAALGGCLHSEGSIELQFAEVTGCVAHAHYASALGGAVFARGGVYLSHSVVTDSHARATGYASGGGVYALGSFTSKYSTIQRSYCYAETSTPSFAGGVFARGPVLMMGTTISDSNAIRDGGAAFDDSQNYDTTIINSTISHNNADAIGGMFVRPPLYLYNSTVGNNNSNSWSDGAGHYFPGGVYIMVSGVIESSIIASNTSGGAPYATTDLLGAPGSGFNGGHSDVMFCGVPCPNDTAHDDPGLGPLQDNGGFNRTQVPTPGFWDTAGGTNERSVQWDQRGPGFPRQSAGDFPEIGAIQINSDILFANGFNG